MGGFQRNFGFAEASCLHDLDSDLLREGLLSDESTCVSRDVVGGSGDAVLDGNLHVIEPGLGKRGKPSCRHPDGGGDEVGVEPGSGGSGRDLDEVAAGGRLTPGQMHLQDPKAGSLAEDAPPGRGIELILPPLERQRVRTIGTAERAAMGELGQKPQGNGERWRGDDGSSLWCRRRRSQRSGCDHGVLPPYVLKVVAGTSRATAATQPPKPPAASGCGAFRAAL